MNSLSLSLFLSLSLSLSPAASSLEVGDFGSGSCCSVGSDSAAPRGGSCASSSQNFKVGMNAFAIANVCFSLHFPIVFFFFEISKRHASWCSDFEQWFSYIYLDDEKSLIVCSDPTSSSALEILTVFTHVALTT